MSIAPSVIKRVRNSAMFLLAFVAAMIPTSSVRAYTHVVGNTCYVEWATCPTPCSSESCVSNCADICRAECGPRGFPVATSAEAYCSACYDSSWCGGISEMDMTCSCVRIGDEGGGGEPY